MGCCAGCLATAAVVLLFQGFCSYGTFLALTEPEQGSGTAGPASSALEHRFISGCEGGELELAQVNVWERADRGRVIGQLRATGPEDPCRGEAVAVLDTATVNGRLMYRVESEAGGPTGWVSELVIGERAR
jgi:hypothetical protein